MIDVTLRQLRYAVAVADHGHFGRAAEACAVSQPGLSAQVRQLERRLGVTLFERSPRHVRVTAAGEAVLGRARDALRTVDELEAAAAAHVGAVRGTVRVAAIPTMAPYLLPTVVHTLRSQWPDADLRLSELQTADLVTALEEGALDLGLLATPYDTGRLHVHELVTEPFVLALPAGHPLAAQERVSISVLRDLSVLLLAEGHCLHRHARAACELAGPTEHVVVESASLSTLTQMVAGGLGVTLLPASTTEVESRPGTGVIIRPFTDPAPGRTIATTWRPTDPRGPQFEAASDAMRAELTTLIDAGRRTRTA